MQNNVAVENFKFSNPYLALRPQLQQRNKISIPNGSTTT